MKQLSALLILAGIFITTTQAQAFQQGEGCTLRSTRDGFVALRGGPSVSAHRFHKLRPQYSRVFPTASSNSWVYVSVASPEAWDVPPNQQYDGEGYVKSSLIDWSSCSNAG